MSNVPQADGAEPLRVKTKKHKKNKSSSRSHGRSHSEERLYHGAVVGDEFLDGRAVGQPAPMPSAATAGPLRGNNCRVGVGGWGTVHTPVLVAGTGSEAVIETVGVGVATADGRKRDVRGGESEDAFAAIVDIFGAYGAPSPSDSEGGATRIPPDSRVAVVAVEEEDEGGRDDKLDSAAAAPATTTEGVKTNPAAGKSGTAESQKHQVSAEVTVGGRTFHLFGVYDGHRSNHAARFCAEALGPDITRRLQAKGVLRPLPGEGAKPGAAKVADAADAKGREEDDAKAEEAAIAEAFKQAVLAVDDDFCDRRWVSLVRDNGKKFYLTRVQGVSLDFDMAAWDTYPLEHAWRSALASFSETHGRRSGLTSEHDLRLFAQEQQDRWHCYKKELYPGCALCAVLVDAQRGKLYCANTGDCGAMVYSTRHSAPPKSTSGSAAAAAPALPARSGRGGGTGAVVVNMGQVMNGCGGGGRFAVGFPNNGNTQPRDDSDDDVGEAEDDDEEGGGGEAAGGRAGEIDRSTAGALPYGRRGVSGKRFVMLSRPHKPADLAELQRVCSTPRGFVEVHGQRVFPSNAAAVADQVALAHSMGRKALYRINRDVSLSRAIGDLDLKEFGVTAEPDVTVYDFAALSSSPESEAEEEFTVVLAIASDGIWDVITPRECASMLDSSSDVAAIVNSSTVRSASSSSSSSSSAAGCCCLSDEKENEASSSVVVPPSAATTEGAAASESPSKTQAAPAAAAAGASPAAPPPAATVVGSAVSSLARGLVDAAVAITKNNDDVTAVVAALRVRPLNSSRKKPPAASSLKAPEPVDAGAAAPVPTVADPPSTSSPPPLSLTEPQPAAAAAAGGIVSPPASSPSPSPPAVVAADEQKSAP